MTPAAASPIERVALRDAAIAFAVSRAVLFGIALLTVTTVDPALVEVHGEGFAKLLCRWDCGWYLSIVERGYLTSDYFGQSNLAFYPLLPLVVSALSLTGVDPLVAGLLFTNACFFAALCYVHAYARLLGSGERAAALAVALLAFVPHSFVFSSVYTESPFLLLLVAALYHLRREHFLIAGLCAAALSATRATGVFFVFFALAWIVRVHGLDALLRPWRRPELFVPVVLAPLGLFLFWGYCFALAGDAFAMSSTVEQGWSWRAGPPWINLLNHLRLDAVTRFWTLSSLAIASLCVLLWRRRYYEELVLCAAIFLLLWSGEVANSLLRYSMVLFPLWIVLGQSLSRRPLVTVCVLAVFAALNAFLMVAWVLGKPITI